MTVSGEWAKHLRPFGKRSLRKIERRAQSEDASLQALEGSKGLGASRTAFAASSPNRVARSFHRAEMATPEKRHSIALPAEAGAYITE